MSAYLSALGSNDTGLYNVSGRAYPDVAAYGSQFEIYTGGALTIVSGTSCSTPTFAAVIALLNDELINAGKNVLGFLNPWLYANSGALNDVATGNNLACSEGSTGFYAAAGWDPVRRFSGPLLNCQTDNAMFDLAGHWPWHAELFQSQISRGPVSSVTLFASWTLDFWTVFQFSLSRTATYLHTGLY